MAFEIANKLGLNKNIIEAAKSNINSKSINIEELLKNIYDDKALIEKEKEKILSSSSEIESIKNALKVEKENLENSKKEILNKAKQEARDILIDAKEEVNEIIKKISSNKNADKLRKELNEKIEELSITNETVSNPISNVKIGMNIFIPSLNQEGIILSKPNKNNNVTVQIGNAKMQLNICQLEEARNIPNKNDTIYSKNSTSLKAKYVNPEINVIGYNVDEATFAIDKFLDDCYIAKIKTARVVHGKGTGALRKGIHEFLKTHPHVQSYRIGTFGEGEMGVTIVEIK